MRKRIITRKDLENYMGKSSYKEFIKALKKKMNTKNNECIWIIAENASTRRST